MCQGLCAIIVLSLFVAVTSAHGTSQEYRVVSWIENAKKLVKGMMKDPDSVQFRNVYFTRRNQLGVPMVCGYVNSKNALGGYTGFQGFLSGGTRETTFVEEQMARSEFNKAWNAFCR